MDWATSSDLMLVTSIRIFGVGVTYTRSSVDYAITAIFDKNYEMVDPDTHAMVSSNRPVICCRIADLPGGTWSPGDTVTYDGVTYKTVDKQADSEGAIAILLHKM